MSDTTPTSIPAASEPIQTNDIIAVENIKETLSDQNFTQKVGAATTLAVELYRVLVSSFLILFVPQKCGDHVCSYSENLVLENELYSAGIVLNFITMIWFLALYYIEIKRENKLITYLDVNKNMPTDNDSVGECLDKLDDVRKNAIWKLDKMYQRGAYSAMIVFAGNSIVSGIVIYNYYLDNQTTTTLVTNILFMVTKLYDIYVTVHTDRNIFYSAYLRSKVQFNDVDPKKCFSKYINEPNTTTAETLHANTKMSVDAETSTHDLNTHAITISNSNNIDRATTMEFVI